MRALLTTQAAVGHFNPMATVADALAASDWEVGFACVPSFCHSVRAPGFGASPMGSDWSSRDLPETFGDVPLDARNRWVKERLWSDLAPDVIVSGRAELAGPTVGEELGVPCVVTSAGRVIAIRQLLSEIESTRERWRAELGLPLDPGRAWLYRNLYVHMIPPSFVVGSLSASASASASASTVRPESFGRPAGASLPSWLGAPGSGTAAYAIAKLPGLEVAVEAITRVAEGEEYIP